MPSGMQDQNQNQTDYPAKNALNAAFNWTLAAAAATKTNYAAKNALKVAFNCVLKLFWTQPSIRKILATCDHLL